MLISFLFKYKKLTEFTLVFLVFMANSTYFYLKGKDVEKQKCINEQRKVVEKYTSIIDKVSKENAKNAKLLEKYRDRLNNVRTKTTNKIIEYIEKNPDSDTVVFGPSELRILNDAQKGITTEN